MIDRLQSFFSTIQYPYTDTIKRQRAWLILRMVQLISVMGILASLTIVTINLITGVPIDAIQFIGFAVLFFGVFLVGLLQNGYERLAGFLLVGILFIFSLPNIGMGSLINNSVIFITPVIIASLLFKPAEVFITWSISAILIGQTASNIISTTSAQDTTPVLINTALAFIVMTLATVLITYYVYQSEQQATRFESDARRIRRISQVASTINNITDESEIIATTLNIIRTQLDYAHTNYYTLNPDLEIQQRIREGVNRLPENVTVVASNAVAESVRLREPVIVTLSSDITRRRHFEPGTIAAVAVPIKDPHGDEVLGILDIQSSRVNAITSDEINTLQALANLIYSSIKQARLIRDMRNDIDEQQRIIATQRDRLRASDARDGQMLNRVWNDYVEARQRGESIGYDMQSDHHTFTMAVDLPADIRETIEAGNVVVMPDTEDPNRQRVSIPIQLRDQVIGAMSFRLLPHRTANTRQIELMQNVVQRLGLALENQRLVEQSQTQAQRESRANEVGSILLGTTDIESLLTIAAERFNQAMGAIQTHIQLQPNVLERALTDDTGETTS